ncbi:hypothetical protein ACNKHP_01880 [Shigella boydii]
MGGYLYDVRKNGTNWELTLPGHFRNQAPNPEPTPAPAQPPIVNPILHLNPLPRLKPTTTADAGGDYLMSVTY